MKFFLNENLCSKMQLDTLEENELVFCLLGLNDLEKDIFLFLLRHPESTVIEIADAVDKHRSSVQKSVGQLMDKGLIMRKSVNLRRGYNFVYYPIPKKRIKENLLQDIEMWSKLVKERVREW